MTTPTTPASRTTPTTSAPATPANHTTPASPAPSRTRELVVAALIAAMMAAVSWFAAYVYPIPFTLQTLFVALAALLLTPRGALLAMATYLGLGLVGLPVFAGGLAGPAVLVGPTGGYLVGFLVGAPLGAAVRQVLTASAARQFIADVAAVTTVVVASYLLGVPWMAFILGMGIGEAALVGAVPFLWADAAKGVTAGILAWMVRRAVPGGTR